VKLYAPEELAVVVALDAPLNVTVAPLPPVPLIVPEMEYPVAATPVPVKETAAGEPGALLVMLKVPGSVPAEVGANCAVTVVLCPTGTFAGVVNPLTLYLVPLAVTWLMVRVALPVFVSVNVCVAVCPSTTLPKL
jgi:hypothetical protein